MKAQQGFTLIELMLVVVVIGILSSIALPSYNNYIVKSKRTAAQAALSEFANAMERHRLRTGTYSGAVDGDGKPLVFSEQVPVDGGSATYELTAETTATTYKLTATPVGSQQSDGVLTLNHIGERCWGENPCTPW